MVGSVICQDTCPPGMLYGSKSCWTRYGKKLQPGSTQVRLAHGTFKAEWSVDRTFKESGPRTQEGDEVRKAITA